MNLPEIELVPVAQVKIVNPRDRNRVAWLAIVSSIRSVGLKKPILVSRRDFSDAEGNTFDLVCGQGRLEAFKELGEDFIPAIISDASQPDRYLMSLVENIARKAASNRSLFYEVRNLLDRGYDSIAIAGKLGIGRHHLTGIVHLVEHGELKLLQEVEKGELPVSVAVAIASGNDEGIQRALSEGYSSGEFRGSKLKPSDNSSRRGRGRQLRNHRLPSTKHSPGQHWSRFIRSGLANNKGSLQEQSKSKSNYL